MSINRGTVLVCMVGCLLLLANTASAAFIPPNLPPGSQYQLIFVTADTRDATSSDIADYNAFVTQQAAMNPLLPAATWAVVGSTGTVNAAANAVSFGLEVYTTAGTKVADGFLYSGFLVAPVDFDQFAGPVFANPWTGSLADGSAAAFPLGSETPYFGDTSSTTPPWLSSDFEPPARLEFPFYALSSPITVTAPEPSSIALFAVGLIALGFHGGRRERRKCVARARPTDDAVSRKSRPG